MCSCLSAEDAGDVTLVGLTCAIIFVAAMLGELSQPIQVKPIAHYSCAMQPGNICFVQTGGRCLQVCCDI